MAMSIDGLVSGLSASDLVTQLMRVEAMPQDALKKKVELQTRSVSAYQSVNAKMATLLTAAKDLSAATSWGAMKTTSSAAGVATATATAGATGGSLTFKVNSLAAAHTVTFAGTVSATSANAISGNTFDVRKADGSTVTVTPADKSLGAVVTAINGTTDAAYTAAAVQVAPGAYTLQLTAKKSGADGAFAGAPTQINRLGASKITTQGANAQLTVGTTNPYTITSASNTFADVLPGISITATGVQAAGDAPVTIGIESDKDAISKKVQSFVDAANAALTEIANQTRPKSGGSGTSGPLAGDATLRKLSQDILTAVGGGAGALGSLRDVGIEVSRQGKITFDSAKFGTAYAADPAKTRKYFDSYSDVAHANATAGVFNAGWDTANGVARKLEVIGLVATEGVRLPTRPNATTEGLLTGLINRKNDFIGDLNDQVTAWDSRLAVRKSALEKQFSGLEVALGRMKQQSSWLSGQLASLPSG